MPDKLGALEIKLKWWDAGQHPGQARCNMALFDEDDALEVSPIKLKQQL